MGVNRTWGLGGMGWSLGWGRRSGRGRRQGACIIPPSRMQAHPPSGYQPHDPAPVPCPAVPWGHPGGHLRLEALSATAAGGHAGPTAAAGGRLGPGRARDLGPAPHGGGQPGGGPGDRRGQRGPRPGAGDQVRVRADGQGRRCPGPDRRRRGPGRSAGAAGPARPGPDQGQAPPGPAQGSLHLPVGLRRGQGHARRGRGGGDRQAGDHRQEAHRRPLRRALGDPQGGPRRLPPGGLAHRGPQHPGPGLCGLFAAGAGADQGRGGPGGRWSPWRPTRGGSSRAASARWTPGWM